MLLYDQQVARGDDLLRWSDYRDLGELKGALAKHAEVTFSALQPHQQRAFPLVMRHLVTLSQGEEEAPNRRTAPYRDIIALGEAGQDQRAFVDLFIEKRLFVADTDPQGEVMVSVAHEAVLREWQRSKEWLAENREFLRMRDRLDSSLRQWKLMQLHRDYLLPLGLPLAEGQKLGNEFEDSLNGEQLDYISKSISEQTRKRNSRNRIRKLVTVGFAILTASQDKTAKLWDAFSGELLASFEHQDRIWHAAFNLDGTRILTASADHSAKLWDATSGKLITSFHHQDEVNDAVFSPDGRRILTASKDKTAKLWEAASGELVASFEHKDLIWHAAFSPDGARILTASRDKTAKLWDAASGKLIASFEHRGSVNDATFSPDGTRILTASLDRSARLWDAASGKLIVSFEHQDEVSDANFSPDGLRVLTASLDNTARLWDAASGKPILSFSHQDGVLQAAFSADGTQVLTASRDKTANFGVRPHRNLAPPLPIRIRSRMRRSVRTALDS